MFRYSSEKGRANWQLAKFSRKTSLESKANCQFALPSRRDLYHFKDKSGAGSVK